MRWFLNRSGQAEGPLEEAALVESIRRGEVPPTAQICAEGSQSWQPLLAHPPFAQASAQSKPSGVAPTMAIPSMAGAQTPGMLGSLGGSAPGTPPPGGGTPAPGPGPGPGTPPPGAMTPAPGAATPPPGPMAPPPGPMTPAPSQPGAPAAFAPSPAPGAPAAPSPSGFPPPSQPPPGQPSPFTPAPGAAPEKKSNLPMMLGGGCALLLIVGLCIGGGALAYSQLGSDRFAERSQNLGDIVTRVAVDGQHEDASDWTCVSGEDLMSSPGTTRATMAPLGGHPEIVLTAVELIATQGSYNVRGLALVFPDGRVRFSNIRTQPIYDFMEQPTGWSTGRERDQDMLAGVDRLLEVLAAEDCEVDWVTAGDLEGLPTDLVGEIMEGVAIPPMNEACGVVDDAEGWERSVAGVSVIVQGNDRTAVLNTALGQAPGTSVCLAPIRARVMDEPEPATP